MSRYKVDPSLEARALADYARHLGKVVEVGFVSGYHGDDSVEILGPFLVKVTKTSQGDILHWNDEWLDPYWNVTPVGKYPELNGVRSFWANGPSYSTSGEVDKHPPRLVSLRERTKRWLGK